MSAEEKADILKMVEPMTRRKRQALAILGVAKSTYYRWRKKQAGMPKQRKPWNRITPEEVSRVLSIALASPELSSRQLAVWITDHEGFAVSESTVYRILKREGLVKRQEVQLKAAKEYHTKTTRPHQHAGQTCNDTELDEDDDQDESEDQLSCKSRKFRL